MGSIDGIGIGAAVGIACTWILFGDWGIGITFASRFVIKHFAFRAHGSVNCVIRNRMLVIEGQISKYTCNAHPT
jgi:hypothetical protein